MQEARRYCVLNSLLDFGKNKWKNKTIANYYYSGKKGGSLAPLDPPLDPPLGSGFGPEDLLYAIPKQSYLHCSETSQCRS